MILGGEFTIAYGFLIWGIVLVLLLLVQRTQATFGVGLVLAYFLNLGLIHLPGAYLYLNPDYQLYDRNWVILGFEQSSYAIAAFGVGAAGTLWLIRQSRFFAKAPKEEPRTGLVVTPWLHRFYVIIGLVSYFFISPLARGLPTAASLVAVLNQLLLVGICLGMWNAWRSGKMSALLFWTLTLGLLPIMTVLSQGFLGYGAVALMTGLAFLASFFRPRWLVVVVGVVFLFVGLSAFVTYFRDRTEIRRVVWGGQTVEERIGQLAETFSDFEWFDPSNRRHANYIDGRLNQNWLVGAAVEQVRDGKTEFKLGSTVADAAIAVVPRALWSDKPVRSGSGNLVTAATGIDFAEGTSVGIGQVLEFYINFGTPGVMVGAFLWGVVMAVLDTSAAFYLTRGRMRPFTVIYLVGLGFNQPGGSLVDVAATVAAGVVTALLVNDVIAPFFLGIFQERDELPVQVLPRGVDTSLTK